MTTIKLEKMFLKEGLSVSMALMQTLDIMQHAANDQFFNTVWNMLNDGGVYVAPNGSTPLMSKDAKNRRWVLEFDTNHPCADFWRKNLEPLNQ